MLLAGVLASMAVLAQDPGRLAVGKKITEVRIVGHKQVSEHEIRGQIKTRPGQLYNRDAIQQDIRNIYSLGRFIVVEPEVRVTDAGVIVTFKVSERSRLESVEFQGARSIKSSKLRAEAGFAVGDFLDPGKLALARQNILDLYRRQGHYFADVAVDQDALARGQLLFVIREGPRVRVRKVKFQGNDTMSAAPLNRAIETAAYRWLLSAGILDERTVKADVIRLLQFYRDAGYLDVTASYELDFTDDKKKVVVIFLVHEGPRYRVGTVRFEGNRIFDARQLRGKMLLQPDQFYTAEARQHDAQAIKNLVYGAEGYINAQVDLTPAFADEKGRVNLVVRLREGRQIRTARINIAGNEYTKDKVIRRKLKFYPEQPYSVPAAEQSRQQLMNTGLFSKVDIIPSGTGPGDDRDVLVLVEEGKTTTFLVGMGVSSDAGLLGSISIDNRNFDLFGWPKTWKQLFTGRAFKGAGQRLRLVAEPGTEIMRFQVQFYEPYLLDKPVSLGTNLFLFMRPREAYDESRLGYVVSLGRRLREDWSVEGAFRLEGVDISGVDTSVPKEIADDEGMHALVAGKFTIARDTTDNRFLPTRGDRLTFAVEPAGGTDAFARMTGQYRIYRTLRTDVYDRKSTVSGRVAVGYIAGEAPIYERFYAGGLSTMRGFRYRGVGPHKGVDDDPIGGHFQVLAGIEHAFPLWGQSKGVLFLDAGTVEETAAISSWRASVGFEVRIPIEYLGSIPLTFGIGVPIAKDSEDETQLFHFLFGTSF